MNKDESVGINRRTLLKMVGVTAGSALVGNHLINRPAHAGSGNNQAWNSGDISHIIPTANHERFLVKVSFKSAKKVCLNWPLMVEEY